MAIHKRAHIVLFGHRRVYLRLASAKKGPVSTVEYPALGGRDLLTSDCKERMGEYMKGEQVPSPMSDMAWSRRFLELCLSGRSFTGFRHGAGVSAFGNGVLQEIDVKPSLMDLAKLTPTLPESSRRFKVARTESQSSLETGPLREEGDVTPLVPGVATSSGTNNSPSSTLPVPGPRTSLPPQSSSAIPASSQASMPPPPAPAPEQTQPVIKEEPMSQESRGFKRRLASVAAIIDLCDEDDDPTVAHAVPSGSQANEAASESMLEKELAELMEEFPPSQFAVPTQPLAAPSAADDDVVVQEGSD